MLEEKSEDVHNTIFDDVFHTMAQKMPFLLIPLINEVFKTDYLETEKFVQYRNEHQEVFGKVITDSIIAIRNKTYHIECQSNEDYTMALRMVEYDFAIALEQAVKKGHFYEMDFPSSCVLYLRTKSNTPETLAIKVNFPNGNSCVYETPIIKVSNYSKEEIFRKHLLFLLPYYIMRYEESFHEIAEDANKLHALLEEYSQIRLQLEYQLLESEKAAVYADLIKLITKISDYMLRQQDSLRKEVHAIMGGQILELHSEKMLRLGREEGREAGREEERLNSILQILRNGTEEDARKFLNATEEEIQRAKENI